MLEGGLVNWAESQEILTFDARNDSQWNGDFPLEANLVVRRWNSATGKTDQERLV